MSNIEEFLCENGWPKGIQKAVMNSKDRVAFRYIVVDNSHSMRRRYCHQIFMKEGQSGCPTFKVLSRWDEVSQSVRMISSLANAAKIQTEVRLLNSAEPVIVGQKEDDEGKGLATVTSQLLMQPSGQTPICAQLKAVIDQLKSSEFELRASNRIAMLIIMTDGESSDGCIIDVLKELEGFPLQIIIRICTDEIEITEYWHHISAQLDLEIYVLDDLKSEATVVKKCNPWLTYGEPLHLLREFGIMIPGS